MRAGPTTSPARTTTSSSQGTAGSKGGLGYFGYTYYEENADKVNAVQIDGGGGCVSPSAETVQDGTYTPLARPLFIYPSVGSMSDNEAFADVRPVLRGQ